MKRGMLCGAIPFLIGIVCGVVGAFGAVGLVGGSGALGGSRYGDAAVAAVIICGIAAVCADIIILLHGLSRARYLTAAGRLLCAVLCIGLFIAGALRGNAASSLATESVGYLSDGRELSLCGTVYKKEYKNDTLRLYLKYARFDGADGRYPARLIITASDGVWDSEPPIGSVVAVRGTASELHIAENDGGFSERDYYISLGVYGRLRAESVEITRLPRVGLGERLYRLRARIREVYEEALPGEESGILAAMTLGERDGLTDEVRELFQSAGIAHILAISGLHISIVGAGIFSLLRRRRSLWVSGAASLVIVILYGYMTGGSASTLRAVLMYAVLVAARISGESYDALSALAFAAVVLLAREPMYILNSGFIFSFGAVLGVCLVATPLTESYERYCRYRWESVHKKERGQRWRRDVRETVISGLISSAAIQLATIPMVAYFYYEVPLYVVGLNLLFLPILRFLIEGGLLGGLVGSVPAALGISGVYAAGGGIAGVVNALFVAIRSALLFPCHIILYFYEFLSDHSLRLPMARLVTGRPAVWQLVIYYVLLFGFVRMVRRRAEAERRVAEERRRGRAFFARYRTLIRRLVASLAVFFAVGIFIINITPRVGLRVTMLSVGQGDGIVVESPEGVVCLIDGGSSSNDGLADYVLRPYLKYHGYDHIDYWLISHLDADHCSGGLALLRDGYDIGHIVLAAGLEKNENYAELVRLADERGIKIFYMEPGDAIATDTMRLACLYPESPSVFAGTNENSMVLWLSCEDFDAIFTGDMGIEQERAMLYDTEVAGLAAERGLELLKVAHHGSKNSSSEEWLAALSPDLAIISAGAHNSYHHPSPDTLDRLDALAIPHLCTIDTGQITVTYRGGEVRVETFCDGESFIE